MKILGRGAFGEVWLCRTPDNKFVAIKKLKKETIIYKNQVAHLKSETKLLQCTNSEWIPQLYCTF